MELEEDLKDYMSDEDEWLVKIANAVETEIYSV